MRHLGGAFTRPSDTPHGSLAEPYALYVFGIPTTPSAARAVATRQRAFAESLPVSGRTFLNPGETAAGAFAHDALTRLRDIKRRHDPHDVFRSNSPSGPERPGQGTRPD